MLWFAPASLLAIFLLGRGWGLAAVLGAVLYISFIVLIEKLAPNLIRSDLGSGLLAETYRYLSVCLPLLVSASFGYLTMWQYEQARSALDESQRWFRGIIDSLPVGVIIENQDGLIVQGNREAQRIVGVDLETLQGAAATAILGVQNSELARSIAEDGQDIDVSRPGQKALPVHLNAAKLEGFDQFTIISLVNRNQQKKLEREVKEKEAKAIVAARLASLGEMAGGIAHEINNPLAIITGYTSRLTRLIHKDRYEPDHFIKLLGNIDRTSKRISQIINGLRIISRNSDGEGYEYQAMIQVVEDISGVSFEKFNSHGVEIRIDRENQDFFERFYFRRVQVAQVLMNLLNNAFHAAREQADKWIEIQARINNQKFQLAVIDSGSGVPKEIEEKIFDPFFTTKEVGEGTGLGLGISRSMIEDHGGQLFLDQSSPHTRFVIELPMHE